MNDHRHTHAHMHMCEAETPYGATRTGVDRYYFFTVLALTVCRVY